MYLGIVPAIANISLLWDERRRPSVIWFILAMAIGGAWAAIYATMTHVSHSGVTLALGNFFWPLIPAASVSVFFGAYEFVFKKTVTSRVALLLFAPVVALFVLSWFNPANLVFTEAYTVDPNGFLSFPNLGGPVKVAIVKVYGYLLVMFAAGMLVGDTIQSTGTHRRQALYILAFLSSMVAATIIKVTGQVPVYFDPTPAVFALSGLFFAASIHRGGLLKLGPIARDQTFEEVTDAIFVLDPRDVIVDSNTAARTVFGEAILGQPIESLFLNQAVTKDDDEQVIRVRTEDKEHVFARRSAPIEYGRGLDGRLVVFNEITALKEREEELDLLKQILSRILRHNIRNDLNVIAGYTEFIRETTTNDEIDDWAEKIGDTALDVVEHSEKAQQIEAVIGNETTVTRSLRELIADARDGFEGAETTWISADVTDAEVLVHPDFRLAIRELIDNAVTHYAGPGTPEVSLTTELTETSVTLLIEDNGPGLPSEEIEVLQSGEETDLEHSSGIGLWLVQWIVSRSGGDFHVEETEDGTRIEIRLQRAG
ncbi:MAG: histidine kinase N-terminal 7TM domain-containing protein [Halodesulfurarchaeum sp.]|nr:histidine kinase N-terminal 7TM domain-containing protein [Halodesulfurarchaeum sp.]